jgi:hypothetical protein
VGEQAGFHRIGLVDVFLGQNGRACSDTAHQRQQQRLHGGQRQGKDAAAGCVDAAHGVHAQADAARSAADQLDHALAGQGLEVFLRGIGRLETQRAGDLGPGWGRASAADGRLDQIQNLLLAGGELGVVHGHSSINGDEYCAFIQYLYF